jgi:hypothetical protein
MEVLGHQLLLAGAVAALVATGLRVGARAGAQGLERLLAALVVAAALAVLAALGLGAFSAADEPVLLAALAAAAWLAARAALPAGGPLGLRLRPTLATGALVGLGAGLVLWQLRHPHLGVDGFTYHLPLAAAWATGGDPGSIVGAIDGVPVANYPVTNEVLLSWALSLSGSWVPASVWTVVAAVAWLAALDLLLRRLGVAGTGVRALALASLAWLPIVSTQVGGPLTDVVATGWATIAVVLALGARERPALAGIALLAAALAVGTKTTPAVTLLVALGVALWPVRRHARRVAPWLAVGVAAGVLVGLLWPLRNLLDHGSPLWPFVAGDDPVPPAFDGLDRSFLQDPSVVEGRVLGYVEVLAGGLVLLAGALLAPLLVRRRAVALLALGTAGAALVWANAPYTAIDEDGLAEGATRYLLPALVVATVTLAVAAQRAGALARRVLLGVLGLAVALSALRTLALGFPEVPPAGTLLVLAGLGAAAARLLQVPRVRGLVRVRALTRVERALLPVGCALVAAVVLAGQVDGYVARHAEAGLPDGELLQELERRGVAEDASVAMGPASVALVRGDELTRPVRFLEGDVGCAAVREPEVLVLQRTPPTPQHRALRACRPDAPDWSGGTYELWLR